MTGLGMIGLKPCPFCGGESRLLHNAKRKIYGKDEYRIGVVACCNVCEARMFYESESLATEAWNRRATIEPERKKGKWILVTDNNGQHCICNHCGEWRYHQEQKFCGECGCSMEEGD